MANFYATYNFTDGQILTLPIDCFIVVANTGATDIVASINTPIIGNSASFIKAGDTATANADDTIFENIGTVTINNSLSTLITFGVGTKLRITGGTAKVTLKGY